MSGVLVLESSRHGAVAKMARLSARCIEGVDGAGARLRTVPPVTTDHAVRGPEVPNEGPPYVQSHDLVECAGLVLGSPTRFGNMAAPLKYFLDGTSAQWLSGELVGQPAAVLTSTTRLHGGQESTLRARLFGLVHNGRLIVRRQF